MSGHVHQHRQIDDGPLRHVWAPSTWAVLPEDVQPSVATKRCGAVVLELGDGGSLSAEVVEPAGLRQHTLSGDIPNPYRRH